MTNILNSLVFVSVQVPSALWSVLRLLFCVLHGAVLMFRFIVTAPINLQLQQPAVFSEGTWHKTHRQSWQLVNIIKHLTNETQVGERRMVVVEDGGEQKAKEKQNIVTVADNTMYTNVLCLFTTTC